MTKPTALDTALVPSHEHPYPIPNNWLWVYLGKCIRFEKGKKPEILSEIKVNNQYVPYVNIKYFETLVIQQYADIKSTNKFCVADDILLVWDGARSGLVGTGVSGALGSTLNKVILYNLNKQYIYLFFQYKYEDINSNVRGTGIPHVDPTYLNSLPLPLPPLEEQARIVAIIEKLFTQLDDAKAILEDICASFDDRKSAILHQAFTGKLTQQWRDERGLSLDEWQQKTLGEVCERVKDKYNPKDGNIQYDYIGLEHIEKGLGIVSKGSSQDINSDKTIFQKGHILYGRLRPYLNKHDIALFNGICSTDILVYSMLNGNSPQFINYLIDTVQFIEYASSNSKGINLPRISNEEILNYRINLPSIEEQQEIVRVLDSLFSKEDQLKNCANQLEQIDILKKTILAKAFRGELDTNNPSEPSCEELLKQVLEAPTPKKERK